MNSKAAVANAVDGRRQLKSQERRRRVLAAMMDLRRAGLAADADYAGRSRKGQLTQAGRLRAREVVVVDGDTDLLAVVERLRP